MACRCFTRRTFLGILASSRRPVPGGTMRQCKRTAAIFALAVATVLSACASAKSAEGHTPWSQIVVLEGSPPPGCERLGVVRGKYSGAPLRPQYAQEAALKQAEDLGATHIKINPEYTRQYESFTSVCVADAYRCSAATSATAK